MKRAERLRYVSGVVLAGGESRRMGTDKALLPVEGEPLWKRQVRVLREAGMERVVIVRREGQRVLDRRIRHVRDRIAGGGPLAGLHAALVETDTPWIAVLAVDMPGIDAGWFPRLQTKCARGVGAVARHAGGYEPLAAIYPREALPLVERRLAEGRGSMRKLVAELVRGRRLRVLRLSAAELWRVENWNAPADCDLR